MTFLGIDPGISGAVACLGDEIYGVELYDTPSIKIGNRNRYNALEMKNIIKKLMEGRKIELVIIEDVHSQPRDGTVGAFSFGRGFGLWEGIVVALELPYELVTPQAWRKVMLAGMPKDKGASIVKAHQLFPQANSQLTLKKHHNRADAILLAEFGRRRYGHRKD